MMMTQARYGVRGMGDYTSAQLTDIARQSGVQQTAAIYYPIYNHVAELYQNDQGMNGAQQTFLANLYNDWRRKVAEIDDASRKEINTYGDGIRAAANLLIAQDIAPGDETRPLSKVVSDINKQTDALLEGYRTGVMPTFVDASSGRQVNASTDTFYVAPTVFNTPAAIPATAMISARLPVSTGGSTTTQTSLTTSIAPSSATATPPSSADTAAANFSNAASGFDQYIPSALQGNLGSTGIPIIAVAAIGLFLLMKK